METLDEFVEEHCTFVEDGETCVDTLQEAGHGAVLDAFVRIFFHRKDPKKCLVWLYGDRNTGKTTFIELLREIFCT